MNTGGILFRPSVHGTVRSVCGVDGRQGVGNTDEGERTAKLENSYSGVKGLATQRSFASHNQRVGPW